MKKDLIKVIMLVMLFAFTFSLTACSNDVKVEKGNIVATIGTSGYSIQIPENYNVTELNEDEFSYLLISYKYEHKLDIPNISFYKVEGLPEFDLKEYIYAACEDVENYKIEDVSYNNIDMEKHSFNESYDGIVYYEEEYFFKGEDDAYYMVVFTERDENINTNTTEKFISTIFENKKTNIINN